MRLKQCIFALVAMMSFTFSALAQTTVTTEAELKTAMSSGGEVTLGDDIGVTEMIVVPTGVTATLDLNGHAITVPDATDKHIYAINNQGVLTITDGVGTGSISARGIYNGYDGSDTENTVAGAKLTIEGGNFYGIDANGGAAIFNCAEAIIDGGVFDGQVAALNSRTKAKTTVNGGTFRSVSNYAIQQNGGGELTINNATVDRGFGAVGAFGGKVTIVNGEYLPTGKKANTCHVVYVAAGATVDIQGGTFKMNYPADSVPDSGSAVASYYNGTLTISGGSFTAHFNNVSPVELSEGSEITGGSYYNHAGEASTHTYVTNYVKDGYELGADGSIDATFVARIGSTTYATFAEALTAASAMSGDVTVEVYDKVTLNTAFSGSYSSINFVGKDTDAEIYLDVQGYITATGKKVSFTDLKLSKSAGGFITNAGFMNVAFGIYDVVEVAYTNCVFANGAYASSGNVTFNGCTFYRSHDKYGLWAYGDVNATVEDCTFADYRGIKMYAEGAAKTVDLTVKDTDFSAVTDKPAIVLTYGESVVLEGNTYSGTGTFELDLDGAPNGTAVTSDVAPTCKNDNGACGVLVDGKIYTTVAQAAEVATGSSTVTLLHSSTETVLLPEGSTLVLNGFTAPNVTVEVSLAGEGTEASPYLISSVADLETLRNKVNAGNSYEGKFVKLAADLTLTEAWTPIGNGTRSSKSYSGNAFKGTFDGGNKTISGLKITSTTGNDAAIGLFGVVDGGTVKNLTLDGVDINVASSNLAGGAIGLMLGGATAENITVNGAITGHDGVGGIVGRLVINGTIKDCTNNASVTSSYGGIGGIVGKAYYEDGANTTIFASIKNCTNNGTVTAPMYVGGIVGLTRANVTDCVNNGPVVGGTQTGGIIGQLIAAGTVSGNENKAKITGKNHLGGIIGDYSQSSAYSYYNVAITSNINRGELAATEQCAAIMGCNNIDGFTAMTASGNVSYYFVDGLELFGNPEDMVIDDTNKFISPAVAKIGDVEYETLAEAVAAAESGATITLMNGEHELPLFSGKELTFVGESKDGVIVNDAPAAVTQGWNGSTFHFENLTAKGATENYHGLANGVVAVTYKNCNINGLRFLYATEGVSFEGCAFNAQGVEHSFWTYGASNVTVKNSTFTYTDRAVNCYSENGAEHEADITFEGCSFTYAGTNDAPAGAVEINSGSVKSIDLTMNNCNAPAKGAMWFNSQWDSKNGENTVVAVDDVKVWPLVAQVGETKYADLQEAIKDAAPAGTVELLSNVVVDEWIMFSETLSISNGDIITTQINGLTINGNGKTVTIKDIESAGNGARLFYDATNLNINDLTFNFVDNAADLGGIGLTAGTIKNVTFNGGGCAIFPGTGAVTIEGCTFKTNATSIYYEEERDNLVVKGNTFENPANVNVILLRGNTTFTNNIVKSGRTVNVVSGSPVVTGNNFNDVRFKVYNVATATIENNTINTLAFNDESVVNSTFDSNTLSAEAQAVLDAAKFTVGSNSLAYTKEENGYVRVWGEGGGNAKESYELKLYSGETLIATTKLNNVGNVIDGDVYVTWNFYYPQSNDEYWTTTWEEGHPNSAAQPTEVELYIDGTLVATTAVKMSGADDVAPVVWRNLGGVAIADLLGEGTAENPYLIETLKDLKFFRDDVNTYTQDGSNQYKGKYVKLTADIDLAGENWEPIGKNSNGDHENFLGTFYGEKADGTKPTISNLYINADGDHLGFFARVGSYAEGLTPTVKNIKFNNVDVSSNTTNSHSGSYVAGVIANAGGNSVVSGIEVTGDVYVVGYGYIGGIVGHGYPDIDNCHVAANDGSYINSHYWCVGGIIGYAGEGGTPITNSSVSGVDIWSASGGAAAIAGLLQDGNKLENVSASNVDITSNSDYCMGYIAGNGNASTMTGISIENVTATAKGNPITPTDAVAKVNDAIYFSLQEALNAAAAGTGNLTVEILRDVNLTDIVWNPVTVSAPGYPVVTVEGNNKTITGLNDMLFAGTWAGNSGLIIKNLTIANSAIVNDKDDAAGNKGVGAFIGYPQASETITLENCHLVNSSVEGGHWTGGLIGMAGGYNGNDGPVFMNLTVKNCSVTGSNITGKGSVGGVIGHGSCSDWTNVVIENTIVSGNTITSTGSSTNKAGAVMGTIGAAGKPATANGETKTGGASVSATVAGNTVKSNGTEITTIYGRQGTPTGMLYLNGGTYDNNPIEENVAYAKPAEGFMCQANSDGTYSVVVDPAYGNVAKIGDTYYATIAEAIEAAQKDDIVTILAGDYTQNINVNKDITVVGETDAEGNNLVNITGKLNITADGATVKNLNVDNGSSTGGYINANNVTVEGCQVVGGNGFRNCYTKGNVTFRNSVITGSTYGIHFDGSAGGDIVIEDCTITGWTSFASTITNVALKDTKFEKGNYNQLRFYQNATLEGCTFNENMNIDFGKDETTAEFNNCTVENGGKLTDVIYLADIVNMGIDVTVDNEPLLVAATIGETCYLTLDEALTAAQPGDTVTIVAGDYAQDINVNKAITLQGATSDVSTLAAGATDTNLVNITGRISVSTGATVKNLNVNNTKTGDYDCAMVVNGKDIVVDSVKLTGYNAMRYCYATGNITIKNSTINGSNFAVHFDGSEGGNIALENCDITGWCSYASTVAAVSYKNTSLDNGNYAGHRYYNKNISFENCEFSEGMQIDLRASGTNVAFTDDNMTAADVKALFKDPYYVANGNVTLNDDPITYVASAYTASGSKYFDSLQDAIDEVKNGGYITVRSDIALTAPVTVPAGKTLEIGLGDFNITYTSDVLGEAMINNNGELTISGNGKVVYTYNGAADSAYSKGNYTINNSGKLTIDGATVENATAAMKHASYAINNGNNGQVIIKDGLVLNTNNYAVRQFGAGSITVDGGEVKGTRAVWLQAPGSNTADAPAIALTVNGGKLTATGESGGYKLAVYSYSYGNSLENVSVTITGGELDGDVALSGGANKTVAEKVTVTGGTITDLYSYAEDEVAENSINVSGGTFMNEISAVYCKEGFMCQANSDATYSVVVDPAYGKEAKVGDVYYAKYVDAIAAAEAGATVELLADITLVGGYEDTTEGLRIEKELTIDGKGHKIDCGNFEKGIRIYNPNNKVAFLVQIKNVTIVNNLAKGRCVDTRSGNINLKINNSKLIATNTNSQPLTIGGSEPIHRVTLDATDIDAGKSGYAVISFVATKVDINTANQCNIKGYAAFYLKGDDMTTNLAIGQGTYTATNDFAEESGVFGAVVLEGSNNYVNFRGTGAVIKAVAPNAASQAAFLIKGGNNTVKITNEKTQVITEGNAYFAMVNAENAETVKIAKEITENGAVVEYVEYKPVAECGGYQFLSLADAIRFAKNDDVVTLVNDVEMTTKDDMPICDGSYPTFVHVEGKSVTVDLNGKNITANAYAEDLTGTMLLGVFSTDKGGELTLKDSKGTAIVTLNANDAEVYSLICNYNPGCKITVDGGKYVADKVSDCLIFSGAYEDDLVTVNGGNFTLGNVGTGENGKPWIFNVLGGNNGHVVVNGGTFNADINHQFWAHEVFVPQTLALKNNGNGTWTVVDAVAYAVEKATSTGSIDRNVGYATVAEAVEGVRNGGTVTLLKDITYTEETAGSISGGYVDGLVYTGDKSFTVDFAGKTVTDDGCVNDYLIYINNKGEKASEITFTNGTIVSKNGCWSAVCVNSNAATQNVVLNLNGMNITNSNDAEYSGNPVVRVRNLATVNVNDKTVITSNGASYGVAANTDGSTLNINEGATIVQQNSGTTGGNSVFAAVGGKGIINIKGGTITSDKYGVHTMTTGTPVINISGGTITAPVALKSSTNGGNGELATINVTGGTINGTLETYTENGKIVVSGGEFDRPVKEEFCAVGYAPCDYGNNRYGVYKAVIDEVNFVDGEFTEHNYSRNMTVGTLTYERSSIPTTWTPFYVPFEVPVDTLAAQGFEVAYINGVRRDDKDFDGELDEFAMEVIYIHGGDNCDGSGKTLKANYPYFIRSKGSERIDLYIELYDALLYAAKNATYDCSTFTEKFEITGNASQLHINSTADVLVYGVSGGVWTKITTGATLKPFRFYMTLTSRDGSAPVTTAATAASMSIVVRGEELPDGTTLIYDINAETGDNVIYDLNGRRVLETEKGNIYIINGKKVLVK